MIISIFKYMTVEFYLSDDMIFIAGNSYRDFYVLLEGKALIY